jgi:hypothetical protein
VRSYSSSAIWITFRIPVIFHADDEINDPIYGGAQARFPSQALYSDLLIRLNKGRIGFCFGPGDQLIVLCLTFLRAFFLRLVPVACGLCTSDCQQGIAKLGDNAYAPFSDYSRKMSKSSAICLISVQRAPYI